MRRICKIVSGWIVHQISRKCRQPIIMTLRPSELDRNVSICAGDLHCAGRRHGLDAHAGVLLDGARLEPAHGRGFSRPDRDFRDAARPLSRPSLLFGRFGTPTSSPPRLRYARPIRAPSFRSCHEDCCPNRSRCDSRLNMSAMASSKVFSIIITIPY